MTTNTRHDLFVAHAMQALIQADPAMLMDDNKIAVHACDAADALIQELNRREAESKKRSGHSKYGELLRNRPQ